MKYRNHHACVEATASTFLSRTPTVFWVTVVNSEAANADATAATLREAAVVDMVAAGVEAWKVPNMMRSAPLHEQLRTESKPKTWS